MHASSSFDVEHAGNDDELDEVEVEVDLEEDEGPCFGCCLGGEVTFIGTARDRPDPSEPDGGWGYTPCCGQTAHFDCLGRWLTPDDPDHGRLVESTSGLVAIELKLGRFKAAHKGQMDLYLKWLDKHERQPGEEAPIGLILCAESSREQVELLQMHKDGITVAEYWTELPPKAELEQKLHAALQAARERLARRGVWLGVLG